MENSNTDMSDRKGGTIIVIEDDPDDQLLTLAMTVWGLPRSAQ